MICFRIFAVLALTNWLITINSAKTSSITFAETRLDQLPKSGITQIATVSTTSVFVCAKLCWDNINSTGCRGIIYQFDTCIGNEVKLTSPGLCQMLGFSETTPLTFGTVNQSICQKFYSLPLANCSIVAQSYSRTGGPYACTGSTLYDQFGYVSLNGNMVFNMSLCPDLQTSGGRQGVNLLTIDPLSCTILHSRQYDTYGSPAYANQLATALRTAVNGTLFVAVTAAEPQRYISSANSTLLSTCNVNITSLEFKGNFAFVCVIGRPMNTKWQLQSFLEVPGSTVATTVTGTPVGGSLNIV